MLQSHSGIEAKLMKVIKEVNESDPDGLTPVNSPFALASSPGRRRPQLVKQKGSFHDDDDRKDGDDEEISIQISPEEGEDQLDKHMENLSSHEIIEANVEKESDKQRKNPFLGLSGNARNIF